LKINEPILMKIGTGPMAYQLWGLEVEVT